MGVYFRWWSIFLTEMLAFFLPILLLQKSENCTQRGSCHIGCVWVLLSVCSNLTCTWKKHACLYYTIPAKLLGSLISDFVDSFRPTARINSICGKRHLNTLLLWALIHNQLISALTCVFPGRCSLLPVVNNSGAICNSWKLDPSTLHFPLKGMLPFDKVTYLDYTFNWGDIIGHAQRWT